MSFTSSTYDEAAVNIDNDLSMSTTHEEEHFGVTVQSNESKLELINHKIDKLAEITTKNMTRSLELMEKFSKRLEDMENRFASLPYAIVTTPPTSNFSLEINDASAKSSEKSEKSEKSSSEKSKEIKENEAEKSSKKTESEDKLNKLSSKRSLTNGIHLPPIPEEIPDGPKKIYVSYKVNLISEINAILSTFLIDAKVFFTWTDEAVIGQTKLKDDEYFGNKKYFDPQIIVTNGHDLKDPPARSVKITNPETGEVKVTVHYVGSVYMTSMNLHLFPFDCQNLQLQLKPYKLPIEDVIFIPRPSSDCCIEHHVSHEWNLSGHCMKVYQTDPATSTVGKKYSTIFITVLTQRKSNWFIANIFLPSFILLLLSWLVYTVNPTDLGDRNELALATLMALIANKYVVADQLPKVDYRTMVDVYLDGIFVLQALTAFSNPYIANFQNVPIQGNYFFLKAAECVANEVCVAAPHILWEPKRWFMTLYFDTLNLQFFFLQLILGLTLHVWMGVNLYEHDLDVEEWTNAAQEASKESVSDGEEAPFSPGLPRYDSTMELGYDFIASDMLPTETSPLHQFASSNSSLLHRASTTDTASSSTRKSFFPGGDTPKHSTPSGNPSTPGSTTSGVRRLQNVVKRRNTIDRFLGHETTLYIKSLLPTLVNKDQEHFKNFGAHALAAFVVDKTLLEEKKYIKNMRNLRFSIQNNIVSCSHFVVDA
jgi:hypothetical protein